MDGVTWNMYADVYKSGRAVGDDDIVNDVMVFRFKDELFEIPTRLLPNPQMLWNGYFYEIPIDDLRKIEAEMAGG